MRFQSVKSIKKVINAKFILPPNLPTIKKHCKREESPSSFHKRKNLHKYKKKWQNQC